MVSDPAAPALWLGLAGSVGSLGLAMAIAGWLARRVALAPGTDAPHRGGRFQPCRSLPGTTSCATWPARSTPWRVSSRALQDTARKSERLRLLGQVSGGLAHQLRNGVAVRAWRCRYTRVTAPQETRKRCRSRSDSSPSWKRS